jgi:hypothetical protein
MHVFQADDGTFSLETYKFALLELLPDPPREGFHFSAQVRNDAMAGPEGEVGIYIAHSKFDHAQGNKVHFFYGLCFNDVWDHARRSPAMKLPGNPLDFTIQRWLETTPDPQQVRIVCHHARHFFIPKTFSWREVALEVTPDEIRIFWEGKCIKKQLRSELMKRARLILGDKPGGPMDFHPNFATQDALGLYVYRGSASFRRVVIKPLAQQN